MVSKKDIYLSAIALGIGAVFSPSVQGAELKFATFNASLNRNTEGQLVTDLSTPDNVQAQNVAEIIQRVNPDILLIN